MTGKRNPAKRFPKIPDHGMLNGSIHESYSRCGKPNCKCARGELHGPYYHRHQRIGNQILKEYIPLEELEEVRAACLRYQERQAEIRAFNKRAKTAMSTLMARAKELGL
jgi:hypothetical protein